ncbi:MAG: Exodeoxyribonuclease 7 small subunit [Proteobacteria bacterium]|jgi:exodeoxyribonuclease VII small subunit|nr:MAG: Exodeoxyribonuclease 7 small subunit [Pseudomonadota bacterium]|tara:strand:- start:2589 stop:2810 length:222 start_codon:yes stop_codon:yes gene_type:complete
MAEKLNFEESIVKIEKIINKLQSGDMQLDDSIEEFKQGLDLINQAQDKLEKASLKVQKIVKENQDLKLEDLDV